MYWQLNEAKQKFSQLVRSALDDGPLFVIMHDEEGAVVISAKEYRRFAHNVPNFRDFLRSMPGPDDLDIRHTDEVARTVEL